MTVFLLACLWLCVVDFSHFKVLRAIGKGAFGKVSDDGWCMYGCVQVCAGVWEYGYMCVPSASGQRYVVMQRQTIT